MVHDGRIGSLKRFNDDVREVQSGFAAFLHDRGEVLLAKRAASKAIAPGKYHLPGGHVEFPFAIDRHAVGSHCGVVLSLQSMKRLPTGERAVRLNLKRPDPLIGVIGDVEQRVIRRQAMLCYQNAINHGMLLSLLPKQPIFPHFKNHI